MTRLRSTKNVEIVDLDDVTIKEEVFEGLNREIYGEAVPPESSGVVVTGLWHTNMGRKMVTASIPATYNAKLTHIYVGWTRCRVRHRRKEPLRCFRCHGFGHGSTKCPGPDLTSKCRRCGENGHKEK